MNTQSNPACANGNYIPKKHAMPGFLFCKKLVDMSVGTVDHEMTAEKPLKATAVPIEGYDNYIKLLLDLINVMANSLGCQHDLQYVHKIPDHGTCADRQQAIYQQNGNFADVVDFINLQTLKGI
jgi:hypothetical protein